MSAIKAETMLIVGGVAVAGLLAYKLFGVGSKIVSNAVNNATDASGNKVTAYQGAGPVGAAGALANQASGGYLASAGNWLGSNVYDMFNPGTSMSQAPVNVAPPSDAAATSKYLQGGNAQSGSGSYDMFTDPEGFGAAWGG